MAETARRLDGKFTKSAGGETPAVNGSDTVNVGEQPNGNSIADKITVDPAAIDARADANRRDEGSKRGPGRPKGSGTKEKEQVRPAPQGKLDLDSLNFTLFFAHSTLAQVTKTPELALDETESRNMATACLNVMQHYNIKASQKAIDWGNLLLTFGLVYGSKFHRISERQAAEKKARRDAKASVDAPFFGAVSVNG